MMRRFEDEIGRFLRENRFVKMDSCILCVQKHVSRAMIYYEELMTAQGSGTADGTASVSVMKNHLKILGHLGCAIEESEDYRCCLSFASSSSLVMFEYDISSPYELQ